MDDLISRQAALDIVFDFAETPDKMYQQIRELPGIGWIPCSERLPEEKGKYLVTYHPCYWDNVKDEIRVGIDTFRGRTTWAKKKFQRVIAWMPLPEPYKEEEDV